MIIWGINPVLEALKAERVTALRVARRAGDRIREIRQLAATRGVPVREVDASALDQQTGGGVHQGVVADVAPPANRTVADLVRGASGAPLIIVLDGVEDPQNVGAILRAADAAGVDGIVRQARRSAPLGGATAKASAGALAHVPIATVVNIARALEELKEAGVWTVGLTGDAPQPYTELDLQLSTAFVLGAEGTGLRRLVRERCDFLATIPMRGRVGSLNVAVAAGIVLFEALRQRGRGEGTTARAGAEPPPIEA